MSLRKMTNMAVGTVAGDAVAFEQLAAFDEWVDGLDSITGLMYTFPKNSQNVMISGGFIAGAYDEKLVVQGSQRIESRINFAFAPTSTVPIQKIYRRLNEANFEIGTTTDTAIHIVLEVPPVGVSSHIFDVNGSILSISGLGYQLPLRSTCQCHLNTATSILNKFYVRASTDYVFDFYIATTAPYLNRLVLKLTRSNVGVVSNTSMCIDSIAGGGKTGNSAMKIFSIVTNTNTNL